MIIDPESKSLSVFEKKSEFWTNVVIIQILWLFWSLIYVCMYFYQSSKTKLITHSTCTFILIDLLILFIYFIYRSLEISAAQFFRFNSWIVIRVIKMHQEVFFETILLRFLFSFDVRWILQQVFRYAQNSYKWQLFVYQSEEKVIIICKHRSSLILVKKIK